MHPVQLDALLLHGRLPELMLRPGGMLAARVADRATISIAGILLEASLPENVVPGDTLRLRIEEATPERLLLRVADDAAPAPQPAASLPLPSGREARVWVEGHEPGGEGGGRPPSVTLSYESPALGLLELRLELTGAGVGATVTAAAGEPARRATATANELREAIAGAAGCDAAVRVVARHEPFEAYA